LIARLPERSLGFFYLPKGARDLKRSPHQHQHRPSFFCKDPIPTSAFGRPISLYVGLLLNEIVPGIFQSPFNLDRVKFFFIQPPSPLRLSGAGDFSLLSVPSVPLFRFLPPLPFFKVPRGDFSLRKVPPRPRFRLIDSPFYRSLGPSY